MLVFSNRSRKSRSCEAPEYGSMKFKRMRRDLGPCEQESHQAFIDLHEPLPLRNTASLCYWVCRREAMGTDNWNRSSNCN